MFGAPGYIKYGQPQRGRGRGRNDGGYGRERRQPRGSKRVYQRSSTSDEEDDLPSVLNGGNRPKTAAQLSEEIVQRKEKHHPYPIAGTSVLFPCAPYPSQFSMMNRIVKGLDNSQNCLLESPTGSGKSLALLCSVLAWQKAYKAKKQEEAEAKRKAECFCKSKKGACETPSFPVNPMTDPAHPQAPAPVSAADQSVIDVSSDNDNEYGVDGDDEDFKKPAKKIRTSKSVQGAAGGRQHISIAYDTTPTTTGDPPTCTGATPMDEDDEYGEYGEDYKEYGGCPCNDPLPKIKVPKIYFGTRTHKQIAQIARELAKTEYREAKQCILSSREQTCIDPHVSRESNKTEACKEKRDPKGGGCFYFDNTKKQVSHINMKLNNLGLAWDLEDLIGFCRKKFACPYYGARQLREEADIVFCPYNYLIDPVIRNQMDLNLESQILIFDEGHNMEDAAREAASYSVSDKELIIAMGEFNVIIDSKYKVASHKALQNVIRTMYGWINNFQGDLNRDSYENPSKTWNGVDMIAHLKDNDIGPDEMSNLRACLEDALEDNPNDPPPVKLLSTPSAIILEKTFFVLGYMYRNDMKFMNDYRIALTRKMVYDGDKTNDRRYEPKKMGRESTDKKHAFVFTLHFWCMNPAVAFSDLESARSIILTSGTLSPMNTFQSELAQPFPIQLEASHVIKSKQVWVGAISRGPKGGSLQGTFANTEQLSYQQEVGLLALNVCKTVPHGVLCFLPSYRIMDNLIARWKELNIWGQISEYKEILVEPRRANKDEFDELLKYYYSLIKDGETADTAAGEQSGAFFMAVCRGKVSEGMDFADNNARAVIAVGIPFPNMKDTQVDLKKKFNNQHCRQRGLLTGNDWYEIQAYRAINQALGRCIRHRFDWGALILVDERYGKNKKYVNGLSKWVRSKVQYFGDYRIMDSSLKQFTHGMTENPPGPDQSMSMSQMDMTISSTQLPTSQDPAVLPPHPPTAASPPMDLDNTLGVATALAAASTSVNHTGAPAVGYTLPSQAGGFMVSQQTHNQTFSVPPVPSSQATSLSQNIIATQTAQTQNNEEEVVAAAPRNTQQQPMDLDITLDFKPPLASSTQQTTQSRLSFEPKCTSTQVSASQRPLKSEELDSSLFKSPFSTPGRGDSAKTHKSQKTIEKTPKSSKKTEKTPKSSSTRSSEKHKPTLPKFTQEFPEDDDDPDFQPPKSQSTKKSSGTKRLTQSMDLTVRRGEDDLDIDDRSSSPLLFDEVEDVKDVKTTTFNDALGTSIKQEYRDSIDAKSKNNYKLVKPLFKSNFNAQKSEQNGLESSAKPDPESPDGSEVVKDEKISLSSFKQKKKGRLSRRLSEGDLNSSLALTSTPNSKTNQNHDAIRSDPIDPNETNSKSFVGDSNPPKNIRTSVKRRALGVHFDSSSDDIAEDLEGELVTKRPSRNKRRRVVPNANQQYVSTTVTDDILQDVNNNDPVEKGASTLAVCCKGCGIKFTDTMKGVTQGTLPGYIQSQLGKDQKNLSQNSTMCNFAESCLKKCRELSSNVSKGMQYNSIWSEDGGCCLVFYRCPSSQCEPAPVAVRIAATSAGSSATEGQIWFLPSKTKVAEPK